MRRTTSLVVGLAACLGLGVRAEGGALRAQATLTAGTVPRSINWEGSLLFNDAPIVSAIPMIFRIYDSPTGGTLLWDGGSQTVACSQGLCHASFTPALSALSVGQAYLEIAVVGTALSPRAPFKGVPYAMMAKGVEGSLDISGGGLSISSAALGTSALFVSSATGRAGIGTSAPAYALDVSGDIRSTGAVSGNNLTFPTGALNSVPLIVGTNLAVVSGGVGMGTTAPDQRLAVAGSISQTGVFVSSGTGSDYFAGSIGIGTPAPASRLSVLDGDITISTTVAVIRGVYFPDGSFMSSAGIGSATKLANAADAAVQANAGAVRVRTGLTDKAVITNSGSVGVGTTAPGTLLESNGAAQFGLGAAKSTFTAAGALQLASGAVINSRGTLSLSPASAVPLAGQAAVFIATGNVGIGTSSPASGLHAAGDIASDGTFYVGGANAAMRSTGTTNVQLGSDNALGPAARLVAGSANPLLTAASGGNVGVATGAPVGLFTVGDATLTVTALGVGVGDPSPGVSLHVTSPGLLIDGTGPGLLVGGKALAAVNGRLGIGTSSPQTLLQIGAATLAAAAGGNVGVGTTSPSTRLDIAGTVAVGSGTARSSVSSGGDITLAGDLQVVKGAILNGSTYMKDSPTPVIMTVDATPTLASSRQPGISVSGSFFAVSGSSVGVGTANPGSRLHLSSGTLTVDGTGAGLSAGALSVSGAKVGVGASNPGTLLHLSSGVLTVDGAGAGLKVATDVFVVSGANVGVGTGLPAAKLHVVNDTVILDGTGPGLTLGTTTFAATGGQLGVGTSQPGALLDVAGTGRFGGAAFSAAGNLQFPSASGLSIARSLSISTAATAAKTGVPALFFDATGRAQVSGTAPGATLTVGQALGGTAAASTFTVNAGLLGAGPDLGLASFGFTSGNNVSFGVRATRTSAGADWTTTALGLGIDVDGTLEAGATVWLAANGNVGVGVSSPASLLTVKDGDLRLSASGGTTGIFFGDGSYQTTSGSGPSQWSVNGANIYSANVGGVGIGGPPAAKLHIMTGGQAELDLQDTVTGGTPVNGSHWGLFADNGAGLGAGGNLTFGITDVTNGALRMGLDNSGSLGVATTSPGAAIDVAGTAIVGIRYVRTAADGGIAFGDLSSTYTASAGRFSAGDFSVVSEAAQGQGLYVKQGGNVGLSDSNPTQLLSMVGGVSGSETVLGYLRAKGGGSSTAVTLRLANDTSDTTNGGAELTAVRTNASSAGDSDLVFRTAAGGVMTERARIKADGKVGVGTSSPDSTLMVSGTLKIADGSQAANAIFMSDSSGLGTWRSAVASQVTAVDTQTTTSTSWVDLPSMTLTLTTNGNPVVLRFTGPVANNTASDITGFRFVIDGSAVTAAAYGNAMRQTQPPSTGTYPGNVAATWIASGLAAGSHTFKVQWRVNAGTGSTTGDSNRTLVVYETR